MKVKIDIVKGQFGHRCVYVHNHRVAGDKPWGGGEVLLSFTADVDEIRKALAAAEADDAAEQERCLSAKDLDALSVGTLVNVSRPVRATYKRTRLGWRRVHALSKRSFGEVYTSATLAKLRAQPTENEGA